MNYSFFYAFMLFIIKCGGSYKVVFYFLYIPLQCVQQYLSVLIYDGSVLGITCPDGQCPHNGLIEDEEVSM